MRDERGLASRAEVPLWATLCTAPMPHWVGFIACACRMLEWTSPLRI
jgi:hypothetical protein